MVSLTIRARDKTNDSRLMADLEPMVKLISVSFIETLIFVEDSKEIQPLTDGKEVEKAY